MRLNYLSKHPLVLVLLQHPGGVKFGSLPHLLNIRSWFRGLEKRNVGEKEVCDGIPLGGDRTTVTQPRAGIPSAIPVRWLASTLSLRYLSLKTWASLKYCEVGCKSCWKAWLSGAIQQSHRDQMKRTCPVGSKTAIPADLAAVVRNSSWAWNAF